MVLGGLFWTRSIRTNMFKFTMDALSEHRIMRGDSTDIGLEYNAWKNLLNYYIDTMIFG